MATIKDHPNHIVGDATLNNPSGTDGQFLTYDQFVDETGLVPTKPTVAEKYGLIEIIAIYNRYTGTGIGGTSLLTDSGASWVVNRWVNWFLQASNGKRYRIVSNTSNALTIGGPYIIPDGVYYIIKDRDFAGFQLNETDENWDPINVKPDVEMETRLRDGGTQISYVFSKTVNGFYYFVVNSVDAQGNLSTGILRKKRTRIWVGADPPVPETEKNDSLFGTTTLNGFDGTNAYFEDNTKNWEINSFKKDIDSVTLNFNGSDHSYVITYVEDEYPGGDRIYIKRGTPLPVGNHDFRIVITQSTTGSRPDSWDRPPIGDGEKDTFTKPKDWFKGGDLL